MSKDKIEINDDLEKALKNAAGDEARRKEVARQNAMRRELVQKRKQEEALEDQRNEAIRNQGQETVDTESGKTVTHWELVKRKSDQFLKKTDMNTTISAEAVQMEMVSLAVLLGHALSAEGSFGAISYFFNVAKDLAAEAWGRSLGKTERGQWLENLPPALWEDFKGKLRGLVGLDPDGPFPELEFSANMIGGQLKTNFLVDGKPASEPVQKAFDTALVNWIQEKVLPTEIDPVTHQPVPKCQFDPATQAFKYTDVGQHLAADGVTLVNHLKDEPVPEDIMNKFLQEATGNLNNEFQEYFQEYMGLSVSPKGP